MARRLILALSLAAVLGALLALPAGAAPAHRTAARPPRALTLTIGMGYNPSVQFAPFYVAQARGYYRRAGLDVRFNYALSPNLLLLVGAGTLNLANADGTDAIAASAQGVPIVYVAATYQRFPVAIFALAKRHMRTVRDLRGKTIGVPGRYGATYVGLLAALHAAGLSPRDVTIKSIGYAQVESVAHGNVDAAVGYSANEPIQLQRDGYKVTTLEVSNVANVVGPGLVAGRSLVAHNPRLVRDFVQATMRGLADTIADPAAAFAICRQVPGLTTTLRGAEAANQYAVLLRSIAFWHSPATRVHGLGYADPAQWRASLRILQSIGQLTHPPDAATMYTNTFVAGSERV